MAVIAFSDETSEIWCKAGWAFRLVLDDLIACYPKDESMRAILEEARALKALCIDFLEPSVGVEITDAIRKVATGILAGEIASRIHDHDFADEVTVAQYFESLSELLEIVSSRDQPRNG